MLFISLLIALVGVLADKVIKKRLDPSHVQDDQAKWDVVPTKISMDEILSVDLTPQSFGPDQKGGDK